MTPGLPKVRPVLSELTLIALNHTLWYNITTENLEKFRERTIWAKNYTSATEQFNKHPDTFWTSIQSKCDQYFSPVSAAASFLCTSDSLGFGKAISDIYLNVGSGCGYIPQNYSCADQNLQPNFSHLLGNQFGRGSRCFLSNVTINGSAFPEHQARCYRYTYVQEIDVIQVEIGE